MILTEASGSGDGLVGSSHILVTGRHVMQQPATRSQQPLDLWETNHLGAGNKTIPALRPEVVKPGILGRFRLAGLRPAACPQALLSAVDCHC